MVAIRRNDWARSSECAIHSASIVTLRSIIVESVAIDSVPLLRRSVYEHLNELDGKMALNVWRTSVWRLQIVKRGMLPNLGSCQNAGSSSGRSHESVATGAERYATSVAAFVRRAMIRIKLRRLAANH